MGPVSELGGMPSLSYEPAGLAVTLDFDTPERALTVEREGRTVIAPSPIGLTATHGEFPENYTLVDTAVEPFSDTVRTAHGKRRVHDHSGRRGEFTFESAGGESDDNDGDSDRVVFEIRLTDDGVAYRYRLPGAGETFLFGSRPEFSEDRSAVRLPDQAVGWLFEYATDHESIGRHYSAHRVAGEFTMPGLFNTGEDWALVTEAGVDGTYAASRLSTTEASLVFEYTMPRTLIRLDCPGATPWRVAIVGDLETVGSSSLVAQLIGSPSLDPHYLDDADIDSEADWIEPGRVAWSWWSDTSSPSDAATQREYIDFAAERGWEHVLLDMGWNAADVPDLVSCAHERDMGVFLWVHFTELTRQADRERLLDRFAGWGVDGIKIDFLDNDDQGRMQCYDEIIDAAADRELMLNFHGAVVPTGTAARYPHVMTYEGVMGAEHYPVKGMPPEHNVVLAFTRNVVGPMDYTPVTFTADNRRTSAGHELALSVVFGSGLQHFADSREAYADRPHADWFLERVAAAWDETRVLGGWPGSEATVARRSGADWFVGSITAGPARTVETDLPMLDAHSEAVLVRDGDDDSEGPHDALVREDVTASPDESLSVPTARNGGFCLYVPGVGDR